MKPKTRIVFQIGMAVLVIVAGLVVMLLLKSSRPSAAKTKPRSKVPVVRTMTVKTGEHLVRIKGYGTVEPVKRTILASQVAGRIIQVAPELIDGGSLKAGQLLLAIDPTDYKIAVTLAQARLADARSQLQILEAEAREARQEWRQLHPGVIVPPLAAKQPQLEAARANVAARAGELEKARLELSRTKINAPFDGLVENRNVDIGQYVTVGKSLATLIGTAMAEIVIPLDSAKLRWFHVPGFTAGQGRGADALVQVMSAGRKTTWKGKVVRALARIDPRTRMVDVVVRVAGPYSRRPPLAPGLFAEVTIFGRVLKKAVILPPSALRQDNIVWIIDPEGKLRFRKVEVALITAAGVVVEKGLADGQKVILSELKGISEGMDIKPVKNSAGVHIGRGETR